jgi:hypothetical protein
MCPACSHSVEIPLTETVTLRSHFRQLAGHCAPYDVGSHSRRASAIRYVRLEKFTMEIEYPETLADYDSDAVVNLVQNPSTWVEKGRQPVPVGKIRVNPHDGGRRRWNRPGFRKEVDSLVGQIESLQFFVAILVWKGRRAYTVLDGHHRLRAAKALGWTEVPCVILGPN